MNGVLGGFKNMLRTWLRNIRRKRKAQVKITKYSRLQSFLYGTIALVYFPIGIIISNTKKDEKQKNPKLYKQIEQINNKIDSIMITNNKSKLIKIENEVKKIEATLEKIDEKSYFQEKINEINKKVEYIKNPSKTTAILVNNEKKVNSKPKQIDKKLESLDRINLDNIEQINNIEQEKNIEKTNNKSIDQIDNLVLNKEKKESLQILYIKKTNEEFKKIEEKTKKIVNKISLTNVYNNFYELENQLKELLKEIELLKKQYKDLKIDEVKKYYSFDKLKLAKSPEQIDKWIEQIKLDLKTIEEKKKVIFHKKEEPKQEIKKVEKVKDEPKKEIKQVDEINLVQNVILQNIVNQQKYIDKYLKKLENSTNRKKTLVSSLFFFSKSVLQFAMSPFRMFKNRILNTFLKSVMINNSVKTMKKMMNPNLDVQYEMFDQEYLKSKDLIETSFYLYESSSNELKVLKEQLLTLDINKEVLNLLKQIELLERQVDINKERLYYKKVKLDKIYVKIKKDI